MTRAPGRRYLAEAVYYHLIECGCHIFLLALASVLRNVFLQARDGHGDAIGQLALFGTRKLPEPGQVPETVAGLEKLAFEPSMFRAANREGRKGAHGAPVENCGEESST